MRTLFSFVLQVSVICGSMGVSFTLPKADAGEIAHQTFKETQEQTHCQRQILNRIFPSISKTKTLNPKDAALNLFLALDQAIIAFGARYPKSAKGVEKIIPKIFSDTRT